MIDYRDIPNHPGYRAGSDGSVWSCWTLVSLGGRRGRTAIQGDEWTELVPQSLPSGRRYVGLVMGGFRKNRYISHLVLETFVGPRPAGMEACHGDNNPANDRLDNLRWDTHKGNVADKLRHGTHNRGVRHNMVKLGDGDVRSVRKRVTAGETYSQVAGSLGVSKQTVADIIQGRTWRHLGEECY